MGDDSVDEAEGQLVEPIDLETLLAHQFKRSPPMTTMPGAQRLEPFHRDPRVLDVVDQQQPSTGYQDPMHLGDDRRLVGHSAQRECADHGVDSRRRMGAAGRRRGPG